MSEMYRQIHHKWSVRAKNMPLTEKDVLVLLTPLIPEVLHAAKK